MNPTDLKINDPVYFYEPNSRTVQLGRVFSLRVYRDYGDPFTDTVQDDPEPSSLQVEISYRGNDGVTRTAYKDVPISEPLDGWVHPDRDRVIDYVIAQSENVIANVTALRGQA